MKLNNHSFRYGATFLIAALLFFSCEKHKGYDELENGLYRKLIQFGDCSPQMSDADFFILDVKYSALNRPDSGYHFQLYHHALNKINIQTQSEVQPGKRILDELNSMNCGDKISFILPFDEIDQCYLSAYADTSSYKKNEDIELTVQLVKTFDSKNYSTYLMNAAQQNELSESEAIELLLMNEVEHTFDKHGDCFIQFETDQMSDSILVGRDVIIRYNTFLLDGKQLDETTDLQFNFGRPGQIIGGLQYALSFMTKGDKAKIFLPSYLAFGEDGNSSGLVPRNTPIYFDLEVIDVIKDEKKPRK